MDDMLQQWEEGVADSGLSGNEKAEIVGWVNRMNAVYNDGADDLPARFILDGVLTVLRKNPDVIIP